MAGRSPSPQNPRPGMMGFWIIPILKACTFVCLPSFKIKTSIGADAEVTKTSTPVSLALLLPMENLTLVSLRPFYN